MQDRVTRTDRRLVVPLILVAAFALITSSATAASPTKPYGVTLTPGAVPAGVTVGSFTVAVTNRTGTQQLGSAEVTVPSAFTIEGTPTLDRPGTVTPSGNVLSLRNLALPPDATVTVTLGLRVSCVAGAYSWGIVAKQSNDFNGPPGNTLGPVQGSLTTTVTGSCSLRFAVEPADAKKSDAITAVPWLPSSDQLVSVEAVDGSSAPARLPWFTGQITIGLAPTSYLGRLDPAVPAATAAAGLATFPELSIDAAGVYNLRATTSAAGFTAGLSRSFTIADVAESCNAAQCSAQLAGRQSTSTLTGAAGTDTGVVVLSLNLGRDPQCAGYTPPTGDWYEFLLTAARDKTVVATYTKAAMKAFEGGPSALEICFAAPAPFAAKGGAAQPFDYDSDAANGAEGFVGLLPNCGSGGPCVTGRSGTAGGGAEITFFVPAGLGDPRYH